MARRVAEATQDKLRAEETRRQAAGMMALPKDDRRRYAEAEVLKQQERRAVTSAGEQFDEEARWRQEQEEHGRRLFATAHGQDRAGPEAGVGAGLLGLPAGYSIIGPSVPLEERRADMHARSQVRDRLPVWPGVRLCRPLGMRPSSPLHSRPCCTACRHSWGSSAYEGYVQGLTRLLIAQLGSIFASSLTPADRTVRKAQHLRKA